MMGKSGSMLDPDAADDIDDDLLEFFLSLTYPDALNPDGWFQELPKSKQAALTGCSFAWHFNRWLALKASVGGRM